MLNRLICLVLGHVWQGWYRGNTMTRRCVRCGKFELKHMERK